MKNINNITSLENKSGGVLYQLSSNLNGAYKKDVDDIKISSSFNAWKYNNKSPSNKTIQNE